MAKIAYTEKVKVITKPNPANQLGKADDFNEIKLVVNTNADLVTANISSIGTNTTDIATNVSNISSQTTNISTNTNNIATNVTDIGTNATGIATNVTDIATNVTDIATNVTDIGTNTTNIGTNATNIATNVTDIATNVTNIGTNATGIATNVTDIATNVTDIGTNTTDISARLPLAGGTMTGAILGDQNIQGYTKVSGSPLTSSAAIETLDANSLTEVNSTAGAISIIVSDNSSSIAIGTEYDIYASNVSNTISYSISGSQTILRPAGLAITIPYQWTKIKKVAASTWLLKDAT